MQHQSGHRLRDFLPAVYRQSEELDAFLDAFEVTLFGSPGLDERINALPSLFDPDETPTEFLSWLAQWAAVTLFHEAPDPRELIGEIVPLYRKRGTREYVERLLELYVGGKATVEEEDLPGMMVGVDGRARVGLDTRLGEDPFRFRVRVEFPTIPEEREERDRLLILAHRVVDVAKPAYTRYHLSHNLPEEEIGLVISVRSTVGVDTVLSISSGEMSNESENPGQNQRR